MLNEPQPVPEFYGVAIDHRLSDFYGAVIVIDSNANDAFNSAIFR